MQQVLCIIIGYLFGCILTAELVTKKVVNKPVSEIGSGNPGMANVMANVGFKWGFIVLLGDVGKTIVACFVCSLLFHNSFGRVSILYAGLGAILGHNYPFWNQYRGGKGVAVTCITLCVYSPIFGLMSCIIGLIIVLISKYLTIGSVVIPCIFLFPAFFIFGKEAGLISLLIALIMITRNFNELCDIADGSGRQTDIIATLKKRKVKK